MKSIKYDFKNSNNEILSGKLELPEGELKTIAIFAHCFTCSKNFLAASRISKELSSLGIGVLRFDFTGLGNSEGDFANTNFSSNVEDLKLAYESLKKDYFAPQILIGHSLGGAAVLKLSTEIEKLNAVVTIGAPSDVEHVSHLFEGDKREINEKGEAKVSLAGREFTIKKQFIDDLNEHRLLEKLSRSKKSYLIMHSPLDNTVGIDHASKIYNSLKHPKSFISLNDADHLITREKDAKYIGNLISVWVKNYLG